MINLNIDFYKLHHKNEMKKIAMKKIGRRNLKMTLNLNCAFNHFLCKNMFIFKFDHTFNLYTLIRFRLVLIAINFGKKISIF